MRRINIAFLFFLVSGFFLLEVRPAHAYLDPGTGSLIFQMLVGAFLAVGMFAKLYWRKMKAFFSRSKDANEEEKLPAEEQANLAQSTETGSSK